MRINDPVMPIKMELNTPVIVERVIPNPEGTPTKELKTISIDSEIYEVVDEEARTELDDKVNKETGKGLSTNDYDNESKEIVDGVALALSNKVDKEEGYGLSKNNYSDEDKALVGTITDKLDKNENAIRSNALAIIDPITNTAPYNFRQTPVKESFKALMKKIVGISVVWSQSGFQTGISVKGQYNSMFQESGSQKKVDVVSGHKYYVSFVQPAGCKVYRQDRVITVGYSVYNAPASNTRQQFVGSCTESQTQATISALVSKGEATEESYNLTDCMWVDLTKAFGSAVADYIYTMEQATAGSGIAWIQKYGFLTKEWLAKTQNKIESVCVSAHKTYDGETVLTNTELSNITIRGLLGVENGELTVDGDVYNSDGSVIRNYEQRTYQSGDENLSNAITDGTNTVVKLVTPTTEQTTPFTETQLIGDSEEFIDYEVAQGNRDVAIPVSTETEYYQEMKLPTLPTTSGNHNLIYNPASGFSWS